MRPHVRRLLIATIGISVVGAALTTPAPAGAVPSSDTAVVTLDDGVSIGTLDTTSGATSAFVGPDHSGLFGDAFSTDGNLYGLENGQLVRIDQTTGATTAIGSNHGLTYGLDQGPDGTMYAASYGGPNGSGLYEIDTATGDVNFVGPGLGAMDVTFDCSGTLWGVDGDQLFSYDLASGAVAKTVTLTGYANPYAIMGLFVDAAGDMLATSYESPTGGLFKVDPSTGALTLIGNTSSAFPHGGDDASACAGVAAQTSVDAVGGSSIFGQPATLTATLNTAGSGVGGQSVEFGVNGTSVGTATTDSSGVATLAGVATTGLDAGSHTGAVTATFAGDDSYQASSGTGDLTVDRATQTIDFTTAPTATVGDSRAAAATGGASGQPIVFSADPSTTNSACTVTADGTVTFRHAGSCVVDVDQAGTTNYAAAATVQQTVAVDPAATALTIAVGPDAVTATATATNSNAGTPTGTVQFSVNGVAVGAAPLDPTGTATLAYAVPTGDTRNVAAAYSGSDDFTGSAASTSRRDPTITATVTSTRPRTARGWYSDPVTVRFSCAAGSAQLTSPCPAPVRIARSGAGQALTRIITTTDGGAAAATVTGLNIDLTRPSVRIRGVRNGAAYRGTAPRPICAAADSLSGVGRCVVRVKTRRDGRTHYTATATNGAGLSATTRGSYRVLRMWLKGVPWRHGQFDVRAGRTVTVVVSSRIRPRYEWAAPVTNGPAGPRPYGGHTAFVPSGKAQWQVRVTLNPTMAKRYKHWHLGARVGKKLYVIRIAFNR